MKKNKHKPGLLWITGLSGSGKTTISKLVFKELKKKYSNIILFDGDKLRNKLKISSSPSFSRNNRKKIGLKYVSLCKKYVNEREKFVIIATMALILKVQNEYRKITNHFDVFLDVPIKQLKKRDPKNLYKKFENNEIKNMVGLDVKFDKPKKPSLYIKWNEDYTALKISKKILKLIEND